MTSGWQEAGASGFCREWAVHAKVGLFCTFMYIYMAKTYHLAQVISSGGGHSTEAVEAPLSKINIYIYYAIILILLKLTVALFRYKECDVWCNNQLHVWSDITWSWYFWVTSMSCILNEFHSHVVCIM